VGVEAKRPDGSTLTLRARREVVVSAGATQSPALLMRSGVGPSDHLASRGIAVIADRAGVGENLMEHPNVSLKWRINVPSLNAQLATRLRQAQAFYRYLVHGRGAMTSSLGYVMAGIRTLPEMPHPDAFIFFSSFVMDPSKPSMTPGRANIFPLLDEPAAAAATFVNRPYSRGRIRLRSALPEDHPVIEPGLLSDARDVATLTRALKTIEKIFDTPGLSELCLGRMYPSLTSDDEWEAFIRASAGIGWHASGTCRMGGDAEAIVDPRLKVNGVAGLRVADASIFPVVPSTNTNAPSMMVGEKAAAMILEDRLASAGV